MWGLNYTLEEVVLMAEACGMLFWFVFLKSKSDWLKYFQFCIDKGNFFVMWHYVISLLKASTGSYRLCYEGLTLLYPRTNYTSACSREIWDMHMVDTLNIMRVNKRQSAGFRKWKERVVIQMVRCPKWVFNQTINTDRVSVPLTMTGSLFRREEVI